MSYGNAEFWEAYREYVAESFDRHDIAVRALVPSWWSAGASLLDLGCGQVQEALRLFSESEYLGVDKDPPKQQPTGLAVALDYRDIDALVAGCFARHFEPDAFVSLFSTELTASPDANLLYYQQLFAQFKYLKWGLVAGFYYSDRMDHPFVTETGGLLSWQTIGDLINDDKIRETRLSVRGPSKLFGPNVVEVWRLLERRR